jgi:shikimate dehydrogenase
LTEQFFKRPPTRKRAAVLGSPIAHSLSPALHLAAYADLGLDWTYDAIEMDIHGIERFILGMDDSWAGLSLTMPLKEHVMQHLDEVDAVAAEMRVVNTVLPIVGGGWRGTNTDTYGIVRALREAGLKSDPAPVVGTILGSGATARSAVAAMAELGVRTLTVHARTSDAARVVMELAQRMGIDARVTDLQPDLRALEADITVSALPGDVAEPWARLASGARGALLDVSYHPWPTQLASAWRTSIVASGRDMLLWQAVEQVRLMTGREPNPEAMAAALPA